MDTLDPRLQFPVLEAPLYVLRHGQTAWNVERRLQGALNSDLTALGRRSAAHARPSLMVGREPGIDPADWQDDPRLAEHRAPARRRAARSCARFARFGGTCLG